MATGLYFNQSEIIFGSTSWNRTATFTVPASGEYIICAYSEDWSNLTSALYCYTVVIGIPPPSIILTSLTPLGLVYLNTSTVLNFTCKFTQIVKRPATVAFIRLIDSSNNATVMTLNSTMKENILIKNDTMVFNFGVGILQTNKTYYINLDLGWRFLYFSYIF